MKESYVKGLANHSGPVLLNTIETGQLRSRGVGRVENVRLDY